MTGRIFGIRTWSEFLPPSLVQWKIFSVQNIGEKNTHKQKKNYQKLAEHPYSEKEILVIFLKLPYFFQVQPQQLRIIEETLARTGVFWQDAFFSSLHDLPSCSISGDPKMEKKNTSFFPKPKKGFPPDQNGFNNS